jgi:hypothetical protein
MSPTVVDDEEDLYRSIRANADEYSYQDGNLIFSSSAFDDRFMKPSVDRSSIRTIPSDARINPSDGVTKVLTADVRTSCKIPIIKNGSPVGEYAVDAIHRPIENDPDQADNLAHCQVECNPIIESPSRFKKLKAALANLATRHGFVVTPAKPTETAQSP